jgi:mono/diheme cytochrome c family protein
MKKLVVVLSLVIVGALLLTSGMAAGEEGQSLYDKKCAMCHGKDGVAKKLAEGSANLNDPEWQEKSTLEEIIRVTTEGVNKMPAYEEKLTPEQIKLVAEYIKTLQ